MSITGTTAVIASSVLIYNYPGRYYDAEFTMLGSLLLAGLVTTIVGVPILITGSTRVNRINGIKKSHSNELSLDIAPCNLYNPLNHNYKPGITLRLKF
jgi:hypothetical protein